MTGRCAEMFQYGWADWCIGLHTQAGLGRCTEMFHYRQFFLLYSFGAMVIWQSDDGMESLALHGMTRTTMAHEDALNVSRGSSYDILLWLDGCLAV